MDIDKPHYFRTSSIGSGSTIAGGSASTGELFICFSSRLSGSSSSMKLTKSILSPGRSRDAAPVSLPSSLSRRMRANGSLKGGQASPFFTTSGKKRGCGFENAEPSSPKVTCIGQVRVKTKKKVKQTRSLSRRRGGGVSFTKVEQVGVDGGGHLGEDKIVNQQNFASASSHVQQPQKCLTHRNQRWVHLPISICDGLRSFGADFSCFFPCKGSCFSSSEREKAEKQSGSNENGCGTVFTRWLVSVNDGEGGKRREIELVVGGEEEEEIRERVSMRSSRRHVFEDIEVKDDRIEVGGKTVEREEEAARVSICIPPKNALLLMRCRSDPMKMADLAKRFSWDAESAPTFGDDNLGEESNGEKVAGNDGEETGNIIFVEIEDSQEDAEVQGCEPEKNEELQAQKGEVGENLEEDNASPELTEKGITDAAEVVAEAKDEENQEEGLLIISLQEMEEEEEQEPTSGMDQNALVVEEEEEVESNMSSFEALLDQKIYEDYTVQQEEEEEDSPQCQLTSSSTESSAEDSESSSRVPSSHDELVKDVENDQQREESDNAEKSTAFSEKEEENQSETEQIPKSEIPGTNDEDDPKDGKPKSAPPGESELLISCQEQRNERESPVLPDCLLLMMREPKLSMEVSKETWVCSTDFVRWLPERPQKPAKPSAKGGGCEHLSIKRRVRIDSKLKPTAHGEKTDHYLQQPRRSSCSLPPTAAAASMAAIIEQKLVNAVAYEPLVLTRCKSEPMRTAATKLIPDPRFWKNAVSKIEPHPPVAIGAAEVGF